MTEEEIRSIKKYDKLEVKRGNVITFEIAGKDAYYNADADEKGWEIETIEGQTIWWSDFMDYKNKGKAHSLALEYLNEENRMDDFWDCAEDFLATEQEYLDSLSSQDYRYYTTLTKHTDARLTLNGQDDVPFLASEVIGIYKNSTDKGSLNNLFYSLTGKDIYEFFMDSAKDFEEAKQKMKEHQREETR